MDNTDPTVHTRNVRHLIDQGSNLRGIVTHFFLIPGSLHGLKICYVFCYPYEVTFDLDRSRMQSDPEV